MDNGEKKKDSGVLPFYGAAAAWVLYALLFDLYRVSHFVFAGLLSLGVFILLETVCAKEEPNIEVTLRPRTEQKKTEETGNPELDKIIRDGQTAIREMERLDGNIASPKISADIRRLSAACGQILAQVRENPEKLPQIHKFMSISCFRRRGVITAQSGGHCVLFLMIPMRLNFWSIMPCAGNRCMRS